MSNEQTHELAKLYLTEKGIISDLESPEQLAEKYSDIFKRIESKVQELGRVGSSYPMSSFRVD